MEAVVAALGSKLVGMVVVLGLAFGPAFAAIGFLGWRKRTARKQRRSPLNENLLRAPGQSVRERLEEIRSDLLLNATVLILGPLILLAFLFADFLVSGRTLGTSGLLIVSVVLLGFIGFQLRKLVTRGQELDAYRLGLDAELAVGQELDQLMREGAVVFHDFPAEGFNIDHVVIARQGVFAVETKGYSKPNRAGGKQDATVVFDGKGLVFPHFSGTKEVDQAERQARWLAQWLTSSTGEPVHVAPFIALPGWFVDRRGRGPVLVYSGKELRNQLLRARTATPLGPEQMQRVVHQVEQRCRNVEQSYRVEEPRPV